MGLVPMRLEFTMEGRFRGYALGPEFKEAAEGLLAQAGIELSDLTDYSASEPTRDSLALYAKSGRWVLAYSSLTSDLSELPPVHELVGRHLRVGGSKLKVMGARGKVLDLEALSHASEVKLRFVTPAILGGNPIRAALQSAAKIWRRWLGIDLRIPSRVRVLRARIRFVRARGWTGVVGWAKLRQEDGDSLGALAQAAEFSGVGRWRLLGFGAVEAEAGISASQQQNFHTGPPGGAWSFLAVEQ